MLDLHSPLHVAHLLPLGRSLNRSSLAAPAVPYAIACRTYSSAAHPKHYSVLK
jgi:hypothetical protein